MEANNSGAIVQVLILGWEKNVRVETFVKKSYIKPKIAYNFWRVPEDSVSRVGSLVKAPEIYKTKKNSKLGTNHPNYHIFSKNTYF